MRYIIPATTVVEILRDGVWVTHTTKRPMEFEHYLAFDMHKFQFVFEEAGKEWRVRVETCLVKGTWGRS